MKTIGIVANLYNEASALPGWLESATSFADHVCVYHAGPGGARSDDGTIEILEKWHIPVVYGSIDEGFGEVRTKAVRSSPCDWVMLLDVDERFLQFAPRFSCSGESVAPPVHRQVLQEYDTPVVGLCPWNWENVGTLNSKVLVETGQPYNQGYFLRGIISQPGLDAVISIRRQWRDMKLRHPSQNWNVQPDWQTRIVRNDPSIFWRNRMHETLIGATNVYHPCQTNGPFLEHHHLWFKSMAPEQREKNILTYRNIYRG